MKGGGKMINHTGKEDILMQKEIIMMDIGRKVKEMDMGFINGKIWQDMMVIGKMIESMSMENINGLMVKYMKDNGSIIYGRAMEHATLLKVTNMRENGWMINSMVLDKLLIQMELFKKVNGL